MTNLQSSTGGCFLINGAMVALDLANFNFNDDKISVSVGYPDMATVADVATAYNALFTALKA